MYNLLLIVAILMQIRLTSSFSTVNIAVYGFRGNVVLFAKKGIKVKTDQSKTPTFVNVEDIDNNLEWKLAPVLSVLESGGVAVIPTDSCYAFVTSINSKSGISRLLDLKGFHGQRKPLSLLCKDLSTISKYTLSGDVKWIYKLLKSLLPGPYTFILPASNEVPKQIVEDKKTIKIWKRKEIGIRIPNDKICQCILDNLSEPLICGSVPEATEDITGIINDISCEVIDDDQIAINQEENEQLDDFDRKMNYIDDPSSCKWFCLVDAIVVNGGRGGPQTSSLSTVVDLTTGEPVILRQGKGVFNVNEYLKV